MAFSIEKANNYEINFPNTLGIAVSRAESRLDDVFTYSVIAIIVIITFAMGCEIDPVIIKSILKKPFGPIIGLVGQFVIMPATAYALGLAFGLESSKAFGLFATGCTPGGGGSNVWTALLGGNLDLSMTMTFISTLTSLGFMPLWYFTLGRQYQLSAHIPYQNIFYSLAALVVPLAIGMIIKWRRPSAAKKIRLIIRPLSLLFIIYVFTFGIYANLFMFRIIRNDFKVLVAGGVLPWCGFLLGGLLAWACRRDWRDTRTIGIETGLQNTGIAIILLRLSLQQPEADLSSVVPVAAAIFTPVPLLFAYVGYVIDKCRRKRKEAREQVEFTDLKGEAE